MTQLPAESISPRRSDRWITSFGMALAAISVSIAIHINSGQYDVQALEALLYGLFFAVLAIIRPAGGFWERASRKGVALVLIGGTLLNAVLIFVFCNYDRYIIPGLAVIVLMSILCLLKIPHIKHIAVAAILLGYLSMGFHEIHGNPPPKIDVMEFQQEGSKDLLAGRDPYASRWRDLYFGQPRPFPLYGPGVDDGHGMLTYGFPYPPLSLFLALPGYVLASRCSILSLGSPFNIGRADGIRAARPCRRAGDRALSAGPAKLVCRPTCWTEPFLLLTFSFLVFCACRWPEAMPYCVRAVSRDQAILHPGAAGCLSAGRRQKHLARSVLVDRQGRHRRHRGDSALYFYGIPTNSGTLLCSGSLCSLSARMH